MTHTIPGNHRDIPAGRSPAPLLYRITVCIIFVLLFGAVLYRGLPALLTGTRPPVKLVIYGFSTQEELFNQHLLPTFERQWEARNNSDLIVEAVFGPSGTIANQIVMGAPADIAIFSNAQHVRWLRVARLLEPTTQAEVIGSTPMVIVTRPGNPAAIKEFADLGRPGLQLIHADPGQSGAGEWSLLAEYGSAYFASGEEEAAEAQVRDIWNNVKLLGTSARGALTLFELGAGDALVTYEQDALLALDRGAPLEIVVPQRTIIAQHMVVIVDKNVTRPEKKAAQDFVDFLLSDKGQAVLEEYHLRTAALEAQSPAEIAYPFTVEDLGGWASCYYRLIEHLWREQIEPQLAPEPLPRLEVGQD